MFIALNCQEAYTAGCVGLKRRLCAIYSGKAKKPHSDEDPWAVDIDGAMAELAVAKALDRYWPGWVDTFKSCDVSHFQVRYTKHASGRLIIRDNDADDHIYLLVVLGSSPSGYTFQLIGWILGAEGKQPHWIDNPNRGEPAFWVPQHALKSLAELPKVQEPVNGPL